MLLGFKRRFAPFVEDGSKTHTIRSNRKVRPKVGDTCHCYVDPRQKSMRLLGRFECVRVQDIEIGFRRVSEEVEQGYIKLDGCPLDSQECDLFAWRDGFRFDWDRAGIKQPADGPHVGSFQLMLSYWTAERTRNGKKDPLPFHGDVIHWRYAR